MSITARIIQLGKGVRTGKWPEPPTLAAALAEGGFSVEGLDVRVNGQPAEPEQRLADGDVVTIVPRIKGGALLCAASRPAQEQ